MSNGTLSERRPRRPYGELAVDVILVAGIAVYLIVAQRYPKDGREIPTVVGTVALVAAVIQLIGWFVRPMWSFTHGDPPRRTDIAGGVPESAAPPLSEEQPADATDFHPHRDTLLIMGWAALFLALILVVGYVYGVPLFFLAYFLARRQWRLAIASAIVMFGLTEWVFIQLLTVPLPAGVIFR
ncbi:tripartite tricarboxylate transporter TctB family protein [Actinoplanes sp. NPDC051411]|uniref:tripartite tricarboxylate transporter TctB family protein n=1 Tax=Actinoplanes sp. NPDC051411 TaxID=3155522 RepID=UPI00342EB365